VGTANWNSANPTGSYISLMPAWLGAVTLLAIFVGAISANALNLYSAAMSFAALGLRLPTPFARAAIAVATGSAGLIVAILTLEHVETYEGFLLVIAYWIGPWLGVMIADRLLDKTATDDLTPFVDTRHVNLAGPVAMGVAMVVSIVLFSNQQLYTGLLVRVAPAIGDITFEVGFVLAFALYALLRRPLARSRAAA
jgi:NCS1 family nucleobase:cation symporter-1